MNWGTSEQADNRRKPRANRPISHQWTFRCAQLYVREGKQTTAYCIACTARGDRIFSDPSGAKLISTSNQNHPVLSFNKISGRISKTSPNSAHWSMRGSEIVRNEAGSQPYSWPRPRPEDMICKGHLYGVVSVKCAILLLQSAAPARALTAWDSLLVPQVVERGG